MSSNPTEVKELLLKAVKNKKLKDLADLINQYGFFYCPSVLCYGYVLLRVAILHGHVQVAQFLIEKGAKLKSENDSALHLAVDENLYGIIKCLLKHGAEINCVRLRDNYTPLHVACIRGVRVIINTLLKNGANPNIKADDGVTPLHLACQEGCFKVVGFLVQHGAQINCLRLPDNYTPLHIACENGWIKVVDRLLKSGADPNARADDHATPLHLAAGKKHVEIVKSLLEFGAEVNCLRLPDNYTPLHITCEEGSVDIIDRLLKSGADSNAKANDNTTPLHLVARKDRVEIVKSLLEHGAEINCSRLIDNYTPLHIACQESVYPEMTEYLLNNGANQNLKANGNVTSLHLASKKFGLVKMVESLLNHGAEVNCSRLSDNYTPLHVACGDFSSDLQGLNKIVDVLLSSGADPNARSNDNTTPLHLVARTSSFETLEALLNRGAKVNCTRREDNYTPLLVACENRKDEIVESLLNRGADPNIRSFSDMTPLRLAVQVKSLKAVRFLLKHGAQVDYQMSTADIWGFPCYSAPLHLASIVCTRNIANLLLVNGANPNVKAENGITPLHLAVQRLEINIVESLLKHGADVNCLKLPNEYSPLHIACDKEPSEQVRKIVSMLLNSNADPNIKAKNHLTPLHLAVMKSNLKIVIELLRNSADINAETVEGYSFIHLALMKKEKKIAAILMKRAIKIKVAGLYVSEKILCGLQKIGNKLQHFQENCEKEVKQMKCTQITSNFTVFDVVKNQQYPTYTRNESLMLSLKTFRYEKFFIYHSLLVNCLKKSKQRIKLLTSGEKSLNILLKKENILNGKSLPHELLRVIVSYLTDRELRNLNTCAEDLNGQSSE